MKAQQIVVDALGNDPVNWRKNVLCHNPSELRADDEKKEAKIFLSTHDRLAELFTSRTGSTIAAFPNISFVKRLCKQFQHQKFSVELVFAIKSHSDPNILALDLMAKFRTELGFVAEASYLADLPAGTFRKNQAFIAYIVTVTNEQADSFNLNWECKSGVRFETLLPKTLVELPEIKQLLFETEGPLSCKSVRKNGCVEVNESGNSLPLVLTANCRDKKNFKEAFSHFISQVREHGGDLPACVIQVNSGIDWKAVRRTERSVLFLQSLDGAQILDLAVHLTRCKIDFYFPLPRVIILDLTGVSSATLVRLFQYAEIPIPTSMTQGAFSLSFMTTGRNGDSSLKADWQRTKISVSWGRISVLNSVPAQIRLSDLHKIEKFQRENDDFEGWIWEVLRGTCPQKVLCFDEERNANWYMQFHIPAKSERLLPTEISFEEETLLVEHARPYAVHQTGSVRPPMEETMHEHWKKTARLAPSDRNDRSNYIAHVENNFASLQRVGLLQELVIRHKGVNYIGTCEMSQFPFLFVNGDVTVDRCLGALMDMSGMLPDLKEELQRAYDSHVQNPSVLNDLRYQTPVVYVLSICSTDFTPINVAKIVNGRRGLFVSTTELLMCHAYTKCTVAILLPKGIKLEMVCTPSRHIEVLAKIPVDSSTKQRSSSETQLTSLGANDTNVAELSQALRSSLSLGSSRKLQGLNAYSEDRPRDSPLVIGDGKEKEDNARSNLEDSIGQAPLSSPNDINVKAPPAAIGSKGLPAIEHSIANELRSDEQLLTPTATWTFKPEVEPNTANCPTEELPFSDELAKHCEGHNQLDGPLTQGQVETKSPPTRTYKSQELERSSDEKGPTGELSTGVPENIATFEEDSPKKARKPPGVDDVSEGRSFMSASEQKAYNELAKFPISENSSPRNLHVETQVGRCVNKKSEDNDGIQSDATYLPHSAVANEFLAERPMVNSFEGTSLCSCVEQNDRVMPKARRSQSVGQFPSTPNSKKGSQLHSKSCPPGRHKPSPSKDMVKKPSKGGKEMSILSDFFTPKGGKVPMTKLPLRRAGIPNLAVTDDEDAKHQKNRQTDVPMIDVESIIAAEERRAHELTLAKEIKRQAEAVQLIKDVGEKWLSEIPTQRRSDIEKLACQFLLTMDSTLCFFTVSLRMLALAPWKDPMVAIDVRQAAMVAISRGWYVKSEAFSAYPFTRAELALAAGSYLGKITPTISEDATVALRAIVELLPIVCDEFFTKVTLFCPFCQARATGTAPILMTAVTWKSEEWVDLKTTLNKATPLVSTVPQGWHASTCDKDDFVPTVTNIGPWVYLELRPYPVLYDAFFPPLSEAASLFTDTSLEDLGLTLAGFVCSNLGGQNDQHYWFVEYSQGRPHTAYDSLKGVQKITLELFRALSVTGLLLTTVTSKKPVLRTSDLDVAAGRVSQVERPAKPIKVAGRSASYRHRKSLMPKLKNLGSPGMNLKSFCQDRPGLLWGHLQETDSQKKRVPSRSPGGKLNDKKQDHKVGSNLTKAAQNPVLAYQPSEKIKGKKDARTRERPHSAAASSVVGEANPTSGDKEGFLEDQVDQYNPAGTNVENEERLRDQQDPPESHNGEHTDRRSDVVIDVEEIVPDNIPLSDPIISFSPYDGGNRHPSFKHGKRPFGEVSLDLKAGEHGSPEDQTRRDTGPPQLQSWVNIQESGVSLTDGAACYRASVKNATAIDLEGKSEAYRTAETDRSTKFQVNKQLDPEEVEAPNHVRVSGGYGVISLFDGVSSVVPTLTRKFGYAPTVAILAENDTAIRTVVCAEFGYRADEQWGFTPQGTAALYLKDVHSIIASNCEVLRSTIEAYPDLKWIIVGGSPCQDLTFAGPLQGLLGLAGPSSRLFFILLCIIFTVQQLCGPQAIRFLVENAASMLGIHYRAFCKLLNIEPDPPDKYLWNPCDFGYQITRRRNFFRNYGDVQSILFPTPIFSDDGGPLLRPNGDSIPLAPLLRTRDTLPNGIIRASWTLYQPHALIWDYAYWGGKDKFAQKLAVGANNVPRCRWESVVPPPFLEHWQTFLKVLSSGNFQGREMDAIVAPLIPMFHTEAYNLPFRILKEQEVIQLSGLQGFWTNVSLSDAELVPESWIRNVCGNCFHPDLVSSALGNDAILKAWVRGEVEGPDKYVMNQPEAYAVFSSLCEQIEEAAKKKGCLKKLHLDKTLPPYEVLPNGEATATEQCTNHAKVMGSGNPAGQPVKGFYQTSANAAKRIPPNGRVNPQITNIHPSPVLLPRKVRVTKEMRFVHHCVDAAAQLFTPRQTLALKEVGMERVFAAVRAPVHINFQFKEYVAKLLGADPGKLQQLSSSREAQCPDLAVIEELHIAFKRWEKQPGVCSLMAVCLAASACKAGTSWPLGNLLLLPNGEEVYACYVGAETPKLLFLVDCKQMQYPLVTVVAATTRNTGIHLGTLPRWGGSCWKIRGDLNDTDFVLEQRDGQWIVNIGPWHTVMQGCPICGLCKVGHFAVCPWHSTTDSNSDTKISNVVHLVCTKEDSTSIIHLQGFLDCLPEGGEFWVFHVCSQQQILNLGTRFIPSQVSAALFTSTLSEGSLAKEQSESLVAPFQQLSLPPELFRHFFVKTGGQASALDVWLRGGASMAT